MGFQYQIGRNTMEDFRRHYILLACIVCANNDAEIWKWA